MKTTLFIIKWMAITFILGCISLMILSLINGANIYGLMKDLSWYLLVAVIALFISLVLNKKISA